MTDNGFPVKANSNDAKADLHVHTAASDGTWRPATLIRKMLGAGIVLFALTDHDTTENIAETAALAQAHRLRFIAGTEINTTYNGRNYHILGLGIEPGNRPLEALLKRNRELMAEKDDASIQYLEGRLPEVSCADFASYRNDPERGGWKALNYLIDKKLCRNLQDFFALFSEWGNSFDKLIFAAPDEAVRTIRAAGGVPILAHPGAAFYDRDYQAVISFMIAAGIGGIECYHPENNPEITRYCLAVCEAHHLSVTGGSDCHGDFLPGRCLGRPDIRLSQLKIEGIRIYDCRIV